MEKVTGLADLAGGPQWLVGDPSSFVSRSGPSSSLDPVLRIDLAPYQVSWLKLESSEENV
jgi:hypothetical protein